MFSGIVEEAASVLALVKRKGACRISVQSREDHSSTKIGDSIAVDGACLTVVEVSGQVLTFDLAAETLRRTTLGSVRDGDRVNLERSLRLGDRLSGHFVFGHVDAVVELHSREVESSGEKYTWEVPPEFLSYLAPKGSVSLSGVSLTVGEVEESSFSVYIIPHTAQVTTLGGKRVGDRVNFEVDMLARYVRAHLAGQLAEVDHG